MPTARKTAEPQDHKPNAEDARFEFVEKGTRHVSKQPTLKVLTPGFLRANRKLDNLDQFFTTLEALFDDDALEAVDKMSSARFNMLQKELNEHLEVTQGE